MLSNSKKGISIVLVVIVILIVAALFLIYYFQGGKIDTSNWNTYENTEFNFEIKYPDGWRVVEFPDDEIAPKFNIYKKESSMEPPFDHFSEITNVSVFPRGIPTEGVFGKTTDSEVDFEKEVEVSEDYLLDDGSRFATYVEFENYPGSWNESGFVWARVMIENYSTDCLRNGQEVSEGECDPLLGDRIVHKGSIDDDIRETEKLILSTFKFIGGEDTGKENLIRVQNIERNNVVESPLVIEGEARGNWYFEATFPVKLIDSKGNTIVEHYAEAQGDWMTEDFVPFSVELEFEKPDTATGTLILEKANPSGLPENADELEIPVRFTEETTLPDFEDYSVAEVYTGKAAEPDFSTNPDAETFRTRITEGMEIGVNFAGQYTVVEWGCGTSCQAGAMVDAKTGEISWVPSSELGKSYQKNSRLMIVNPIEAVEERIINNDPFTIPDWISTKYYEWTGEEFESLTEISDYSAIF